LKETLGFFVKVVSGLEMVGIFFDSEKNLRMVLVKTFKQIMGLIYLVSSKAALQTKII